MKSFQLEILTPERIFYRGECVSLIVPITDGMLGIMANREPITASITNGEAYYTRPDGEKILFSVLGGMINVQDNQVKILCESALLPEEIDEEKERTNTAPGVIAAALYESTTSVPSWTQITLPFEYKDFDAEPNMLVFTFTCSGYGDYFTGSTQSWMYIDDVEILYDLDDDGNCK